MTPAPIMMKGYAMFMQIIQGKIRDADADAARATLDRWHRDLEPGAQGFLGGTYGITDDGTLVAAVRFESEDAARRNSERPEQTEWWREMERHFDGDVTFHDCSDVTLLLGAEPESAGFVQVIQGRVRDRERAHTLVEQSGDMLSRHRPDILSSSVAIDEDGFFTETVAFSSEDAAREGERKELPPDARQLMEEERSLVEDIRYLDLHQPWFATRG